MMDAESRFISEIRQKKLFRNTDCLLLAVSGGLDSMVMAELCHRSRFSFAILHCNFQLRGAESDRDEAFVRELAAKYRVEVFVERFPTTSYASGNRLSIQEAARELRYRWFREMQQKEWNRVPGRCVPGIAAGSEKNQAVYVLTAHHADDSLETLLLNFFKGTGMAGLHGILPKQDWLIRPLLSFRKGELEEIARDWQLNWVEDSSNRSDYYQRNALRHQLIPLLAGLFPSVEENLLGNIRRFQEAEILYRQAIDRYRKKLMVYRGNEIHLPVIPLRQSVPLRTILFELIRPFGFSPAQTEEVESLLDSDTGSWVASPTYRIIRHRNWLIIAPLAAGAAAHVPIGEDQDHIEYENGTLQFSYRNKDKLPLPGDSSRACLDASQIHYPLLLRKWKAGDYFYPLGMPKKKKISRFLIDLKLSRIEKEKVWVLEMDQKILWVVGYRIDHRFRVTEKTSQVLEIAAG